MSFRYVFEFNRLEEYTKVKKKANAKGSITKVSIPKKRASEKGPKKARNDQTLTQTQPSYTNPSVLDQNKS
jgi:hypothetical protein